MGEKIVKTVFVLGFIALCTWGVIEAGEDTVATRAQFDACNQGNAARCTEAIDDQYRQSMNGSGHQSAAERMQELQRLYFAATGRHITPTIQEGME